MAATNTAPPMILPIVTGNRLFNQNADQVNLSRLGTLSPTLLTNAGSYSLINKAYGTKYMFAILCSKPAATKAVIGNTIAMILSTVLRALYVNQTARQTSPLHKIPRAMA